MAYIIGRRMKLGDGFHEVGEPIPEAETWRALPRLIRNGWVVVVADSEVPKPRKVEPKESDTPATVADVAEEGERPSGAEAPSRPRRPSPTKAKKPTAKKKPTTAKKKSRST